MNETQQPKKPETFEELEKELDNDSLPKLDTANTLPDEPGLPELRNAEAPQLAPKQDDISEVDLQEAAAATEETEDDESSTAPVPITSPPKRHFWQRRKFWFRTIFFLVVVTAFTWFLSPQVRFFIVNLFGLRGTITINTTTLPDSGQPSALLKNVTVTLNKQPWSTDANGRLVAKVLYGTYTIEAKKMGYSTVNKSVVVDFDPFFHLLGDKNETAQQTMTLQLKAVGIPVAFKVQDWLTGDPITIGAYSVGQIVAKPNNQGIVSFTLPATDDKTATVKVAFGGTYLDKQFTVPLDGTQRTLTFVPEGKDYFISKRGGTPALYSSDLDGSNAAQFMAPSSNETSAMQIAINPAQTYGLLASTQAGIHDSQGNLLQQLFVIDLSNKNMTVVDQGQWFNFVDWQGNTLVYTVSERKPGAAQNTQRLASVDTTNSKRADLATAATFGAVRVALDNVTYQRNAAAGDSTAGNNPELRVVPYRGGTEKSLGYTVQQVAQPDPSLFDFQTSDGVWHEYNVNTAQSKTVAAPQNPARAYVAAAGPDGQNRVALDTVDGKPTLIVKNVGSGQEKQLYTAPGVGGPIRVLDGQVIFRIIDNTQTADYVISLSGGQPKKIGDVTAPTPPFAKPAYIQFF